MGKGKKNNTSSPSRDYRSAPLSTLKDPAVFGPPPKNANYHGSAAVPATTGIKPASSSSSIPGKGEDDLGQQSALAVDEERGGSGPPLVPVRANTTVSTVGQKGFGEDVGTDQLSSKSRPPVPPRLPPRGSSDTSTIQVNQGALNRLGQAGISVPGLDIGAKPGALTPQGEGHAADPTSTFNADGAMAKQMKDLGSRFSKLSASSATASSPNEGTSFTQKQAALRTASSLYKDPTSVSISDATSAASTANNFRQRHGSQVAQGWKTANNLNDRLGLIGESRPQRSTNDDTPSTETLEQPSMAGRAIPKKAPPPPPPKKRELVASATGDAEPPPIPLASKPR